MGDLLIDFAFVFFNVLKDKFLVFYFIDVVVVVFGAEMLLVADFNLLTLFKRVILLLEVGEGV